MDLNSLVQNASVTLIGARMETRRGVRALACRPMAHLVCHSSGWTGARASSRATSR